MADLIRVASLSLRSGGDGRTVYGRVVPYNVTTTVDDGRGAYEEMFAPGSFSRSIEQLGSRIDAVRPDQWTDGTHCSEWDVRELVNHVTGEQLWAPHLLGGQTIEEVGDRYDGDVLGEYPPVTSLTILDGPVERDGTPWWKMTGIGLFGELLGWGAQRTPGGVTLVKLPRPLPGMHVPDPSAGNYLPMPFPGTFGIAQLWGENRAYYSQFSYDGVPLRGHNAIDFLTPFGTPVLAVAPGLVIMVGVEPQADTASSRITIASRKTG